MRAIRLFVIMFLASVIFFPVISSAQHHGVFQPENLQITNSSKLPGVSAVINMLYEQVAVARYEFYEQGEKRTNGPKYLFQQELSRITSLPTTQVFHDMIPGEYLVDVHLFPPNGTELFIGSGAATVISGIATFNVSLKAVPEKVTVDILWHGLPGNFDATKEYLVGFKTPGEFSSRPLKNNQGFLCSVAVKTDATIATLSVTNEKGMMVAQDIDFRNLSIANGRINVSYATSANKQSIMMGNLIFPGQTNQDEIVFTGSNLPVFAFRADTPQGTLNPSNKTLVATLNITAPGSETIVFSKEYGNKIVFSVAGRCLNFHSPTTAWVFMDGDGNILHQTQALIAPLISGDTSQVACEFGNKMLHIPEGTTKQIKVFADTTNLVNSGDSVQLFLDGSIQTNVSYGPGNRSAARTCLRNNIYAGSLQRP